MRLLLTRAAEDAVRTRAVLEARGHHVLLAPVLRPVATGEALPERPPEGVIATSARAFRYAQRPAWDPAGVPLALVGRQTEVAARTAGYGGAAVVVSTSADLIAALCRRAATRLLYLAGTDRKPDLEAALAAGPHGLAVVETYKAEAATILPADVAAALRGARIDAVMHYSRRSAILFRDLCAGAGCDPRGVLHICLSPDVAEPFRGFPRVRVADAPEEAALLALVNAP